MRSLLCLLVVVTAATANPLFGDGLGGGGDGGKKPGGGSFPFVTTETFTRTITTDSFCYTTDKKLLGPKTKECTRKRAIDTSNIMGLDAGSEVANAIAPTVTQVRPEEETALDNTKSSNPRDAKFCCYAVTKTETETVFKITATTTVTFKCTPASSILNMCDGDGKKGGFGGDKFGDLFNKEDKKGGLGGDGGENPLGVLGIGK